MFLYKAFFTGKSLSSEHRLILDAPKNEVAKIHTDRFTDIVSFQTKNADDPLFSDAETVFGNMETDPEQSLQRFKERVGHMTEEQRAIADANMKLLAQRAEFGIGKQAELDSEQRGKRLQLFQEVLTGARETSIQRKDVPLSPAPSSETAPAAATEEKKEKGFIGAAVQAFDSATDAVLSEKLSRGQKRGIVLATLGVGLFAGWLFLRGKKSAEKGKKFAEGIAENSHGEDPENESADAAKKTSPLQKKLLWIGAGVLAFFGGTYLLDKYLDGKIRKNLAQGFEKGKEVMGIVAEKGVEKGKEIAVSGGEKAKEIAKKAEEKVAESPAAKMLDNTNVFGSLGSDVLGRTLVALHPSIDFGAQGQMDAGQVGVALAIPEVRNLTFEDVRALSEATGENILVEAKKLCASRNLPQFTEENSLRALYFIAKVFQERQPELQRFEKEPGKTSIDSLLRSVGQFGHVFHELQEKTKDKSFQEIILNLPATLKECFNKSVDLEVPSVRESLVLLSLTNPEDQKAFVAITSANQNAALSNMPAWESLAKDLNPEQKKRILSALEILKIRTNYAKPYLMNYAHGTDYRNELETVLSGRISAFDALQLYTLTHQLDPTQTNMPRSLDDVPPEIGGLLQLKILKLVGASNTQLGQKMSTELFVDVGSGMIGISSNINIPQPVKDLLGKCLSLAAKTVWTQTQEVAYRGGNAYSRLYRNAPGKVAAAEVGAVGSIYGIHKLLDWIRRADISINPVTGHQIVGKYGHVNWFTKLASKVGGETGAHLTNLAGTAVEKPFELIGKARNAFHRFIPVTGKIGNALSKTGRVLGPAAMALELQDVYLRQIPALEEELLKPEVKNNPGKKQHIEQQIIDTQASLAVDMTGLFFASHPVGWVIVGGNLAKEYARGKINEGTDFLNLTERDLVKLNPGEILSVIDQVKPLESINGLHALATAGLGESVSQGTEAVRRDGYFAYYLQCALYSMPGFRTSELSRENSASLSEAQKIEEAHRISQMLRSNFAGSACAYIHEKTGGNYTLVSSEVLQEAEEYGRLRSALLREQFRTDKDIAPEMKSMSWDEKTKLVRKMNEQANEELQKYLISLSQKPEEFRQQAGLLLIPLTHKMTRLDQDILSTDYDNWDYGNESMQSIVRGYVADEIWYVLRDVVSKSKLDSTDLNSATNKIDLILQNGAKGNALLAMEHGRYSPSIYKTLGKNSRLLSIPGISDFIGQYQFTAPKILGTNEENPVPLTTLAMHYGERIKHHMPILMKLPSNKETGFISVSEKYWMKSFHERECTPVGDHRSFIPEGDPGERKTIELKPGSYQFWTEKSMPKQNVSHSMPTGDISVSVEVDPTAPNTPPDLEIYVAKSEEKAEGEMVKN